MQPDVGALIDRELQRRSYLSAIGQELARRGAGAGGTKRGGYLDTLGDVGPDPAPQTAADGRTGDALKPIFGGHNPMAETYDIGIKPFLDPSSNRPLTERVGDTAAFAASLPFTAFRAPSPGQMTEYVTGSPRLRESEESFVDNNPDIVRALGAAGEIAPGLTRGLGMGAQTQPVQIPRAPGVAAVRRARTNMGEAGAYGRIADDLPQGVETFANQVATGASRANVAMNRRTLDMLGEAMQRAAGDVPTAQAATIARIVNETGVTPQTAAAQIRRLSDVHRDSVLMMGEYPAVAASDVAQRTRQPGNIDIDQLGRIESTTTQAKIDALANNGNAQSAQNVRNAIGRRQEDLAPAMRVSLEELAPRLPTGARSSRPTNITDVGDLIETARQTARQEYDTAYRGEVASPQSLTMMPQVLDRYLNIAATRPPDMSGAIRNAVNQFYVTLPDGTRAIQSLRQLQDARTTVRRQMAAYERTGRNDLAQVIRPLYRYATRVMTQMSPQWARANARWADMNLDMVAQELGDAFSTKAGPRFRDQIREYRGLAPEAQRIVQTHFLQQLIDKMDNLGDTHSVSKLFATDHARNMVRTMFGDEAVVGFVRAVRDQKVAEGSQRMLAGSPTHRRIEAQKQLNAETGLVAAVDQASARGVRNWLFERAAQILTERRNRPMGEILTTSMSDTAQVARHLNRMSVQQRRLQEIQRRSGVRVPGNAGAATAIGAGQQRRDQGTRTVPNDIRGGVGTDRLEPRGFNPRGGMGDGWSPAPSTSNALLAAGRFALDTVYSVISLPRRAFDFTARAREAGGFERLPPEEVGQMAFEIGLLAALGPSGGRNALMSGGGPWPEAAARPAIAMAAGGVGGAAADAYEYATTGDTTPNFTAFGMALGGAPAALQAATRATKAVGKAAGGAAQRKIDSVLEGTTGVGSAPEVLPTSRVPPLPKSMRQMPDRVDYWGDRMEYPHKDINRAALREWKYGYGESITKTKEAAEAALDRLVAAENSSHIMPRKGIKGGTFDKDQEVLIRRAEYEQVVHGTVSKKTKYWLDKFGISKDDVRAIEAHGPDWTFQRRLGQALKETEPK